MPCLKEKKIDYFPRLLQIRDQNLEAAQSTDEVYAASWPQVLKHVLVLAVFFLLWGIYTQMHSLVKGPGVWSVSNNQAWGISIVNFIFWIGVGHAGTLMSAMLQIKKHELGANVSRIAETITICALLTAISYPFFHLGKPWLMGYMMPLIDESLVMPNFNSPLVWDLFAVLTYVIVSVVYWYLGFLPDFARRVDVKYGRLWQAMSWGWNGSVRQWEALELTTRLLSYMVIPLVFLVHTIVSYDFAMVVNPMWHSPNLMLIFIVGAVYSGVAMVLMVMVVYNKLWDNSLVVSGKAIKVLSKWLWLLSWGFGGGLMVHGWAMGLEWWSMINIVVLVLGWLVPQVLVLKYVGARVGLQVGVAVGVLVALWLERYELLVNSANEFMVSSSARGMEGMNFYDWGNTLGGVGLFVILVVVMTKVLPMFSLLHGQYMES